MMTLSTARAPLDSLDQSISANFNMENDEKSNSPLRSKIRNSSPDSVAVNAHQKPRPCRLLRASTTVPGSYESQENCSINGNYIKISYNDGDKKSKMAQATRPGRLLHRCKSLPPVFPCAFSTPPLTQLHWDTIQHERVPESSAFQEAVSMGRSDKVFIRLTNNGKDKIPNDLSDVDDNFTDLLDSMLENGHSGAEDGLFGLAFTNFDESPFFELSASSFE